MGIVFTVALVASRIAYRHIESDRNNLHYLCTSLSYFGDMNTDSQKIRKDDSFLTS